MQKLIFFVYNVIQNEFFTQKIQKLQKIVFFCEHDYDYI